MDMRWIEALESVQELRRGMCLIACDGIYTGGLREVRPHGRGRATWPDAEEYYGQWWQGLPEGHGVLTLPKYDDKSIPHSSPSACFLSMSCLTMVTVCLLLVHVYLH
jgi:hypothetical protein